MKKYLSLTALLFIGIIVFGQQGIQQKAVNPEFTEYQNKKATNEISNSTIDGYFLGEVPSPFLRNFNGLNFSSTKGIPSSYDLRTVDGGAYLTPVKNQGSEGACWAFATYAAIESYWKKQGLAEFDLSEQNLATCHNFDWTPSDGGNSDLSAAYLTRRSGPISESDDPYTLPSNPSCVSGLTPVAYVAQKRDLPGIGSGSFNSDLVKQSIMDNGVIYTNMNYDSDYMNYSDETYYYDGSDGTNHGVAIVGWDNSKVVTGGSLATPSSPGAWIIKNSWGPSWGESGFFYISYEDTKALTSVAYFPSHIDYNSASEVYFYDEFGATSAVGYSDGEDFALVKYIASDNQQISKLGTYVPDASAVVSFDVYDNFDGSSLTGLLGSIGVQTCTFPGYYTYDLSTPINIASGNDFYIKVRYNSGENYPIPIETAYADYCSLATFETGKCWLSDNGGTAWTEVGGSTGYDYDLCIKAYATTVASAPPVANFVADQTSVVIGTTVHFTDLSSGIPDDWDWTFEIGSPGTSTATNPSITYNTAGTYDVILYVSNVHGNNTITKENYITVTNAPLVCEYIDNMDASDNIVYYTAPNGYLTGVNDYGFTQFAEYYDSHLNYKVDGARIGVARAEDVSGSGIITMKIWDVVAGLPGAELYTEDFNITDFTPSAWNEITFASPTDVPEEFFIGYEIYFSATDQDTFAVYQAENRGVGSSFPSTAYIEYGSWNNIDDTYTDFNSSFAIYPEICPSAPITEFSADITNGCGTLDVQFTDESTSNTDSWLWNFGDLQTSTSQNPSHTYASPGNYTVTLTATNSIGFTTNEKIAYIIVGTIPTDVTVTGGGTQCGGTMTLTATGGTGGTIYWQNTTTSGTSTATASSSEMVSTSDTYYFRAQSAEGCWGNEGSDNVTINDVPTDVTATGGGTQCGGTMTLTANGGTGGTIYWQNTTTNGTSTATASSSEIVSASGTYYFRSQSADGCWSVEGSEDVIINDIPTAVNVTGGGIQCGGTMTLTATGGTGGTIYWQNTTTNGNSTATPSSSESVSTSDTYYFRAQSAEGCWGLQGSDDVSINDVPTDVIVTGGGTQCGGTMTLTATGGTGGTIYWQNTTSSGTSTATASASEIVSTSNTYYFRAQSAEDCWSNEGSADVTIHPELTMTMSSINESAPGADDGSVTFNFIGGTPNYFYDFASLYSETTSATTQVFPGLAGGTYCVTVIDSNGCEVNDCETVNTDGAAPIANFEADVTIGCETLTVTFSDLSSNDPTEWAWTFDDGEISDQQNPEHTYTTPGTYSVSLIASNAIDDSEIYTITDYIVVGSNPIIDNIIVTPATGAIIPDGAASIEVSGGTEPYTITWSTFDEGVNINSLIAGSYSVTVVDDIGCEATDAFEVNWVNSIMENQIEYNIFPNPANDFLIIEFDAQTANQIRIFNILGELVYSVLPSENKLVIDISNFAAGTYIVSLQFANFTDTRKIIVE